MWQKCPVCSGAGKIDSVIECRVCSSKGIISTVTGLPPSGVETFASPKYRNPDGSPKILDRTDPLENKNPQQDKSYNIVEAYYNK